MGNDYREAEKLVQRNVYACISDMAPYLFGWDGDKYANYDEWNNIYEAYCPECACRIETDTDAENVKCSWCSATLDKDSLDVRPAEIFEYWLVSNWLGEKLLEKGEPVLKCRSACVWGRCCTGQAIALDGVINEITTETNERIKKRYVVQSNK